MNIKFIVFLILLVTVKAYSQDKRDYQWFLGLDQQLGPEIRNLKMDFNNQPFNPELRDEGLSFGQNNVSICDKDGKLLLYSNGCAIANSEHEIMINGDGINSGEFFDDFWFDGDCEMGYPGRQDILILEDPSNQEGYYVIHKRIDVTAEFNMGIFNLSYSYVDLTLEDGLGAVTEKNVDFFSIDELLSSYLTAINHSNGKDWWIISPSSDNKFNVFVIDNDGLRLLNSQESNHPFDEINASASGDAKFSPDGKKFAYFNQYDGLLLYDFDRGSGVLSNTRKLSFPNPNEVNLSSFGTCEWSSSSDFLYLATGDSLWQVEVAFENLEDGKVFIAEHNGVSDPFSTQFFASSLGPDCRIYIRPASSSNSFHVIHKPNQKGIACDLEQQGIVLPEVSSAGSFPNFPRFRVDEEDKCDPNIINVLGEPVYYKRGLTIYPNPASKFISIDIPPDYILGDIFVRDIGGKRVFYKQNFKNSAPIDISFLPSGIYSIEYVPKRNNERVVYIGRLVKTD